MRLHGLGFRIFLIGLKLTVVVVGDLLTRAFTDNTSLEAWPSVQEVELEATIALHTKFCA